MGNLCTGRETGGMTHTRAYIRTSEGEGGQATKHMQLPPAQYTCYRMRPGRLILTYPVSFEALVSGSACKRRADGSPMTIGPALVSSARGTSKVEDSLTHWLRVPNDRGRRSQTATSGWRIRRPAACWYQVRHG